MKISDIIDMLEEYKKKIGDVELYTEKNDGRSFWVSPYKPTLVLDKHRRWIVEERGY